jgi:hypothetical protein
LASNYNPSEEGRNIWRLSAKLDTSAPDRDSHRLGALIRLVLAADELHPAAAEKKRLKTRAYRKSQEKLYNAALRVLNSPKPRDSDDN